MNSYIKSPLNYIGGKYKLLPQIIPLFPEQINTFVDLFTGGCNVAVNAQASNFICNDNLVYIIELYQTFLNNTNEYIIEYIDYQIKKYDLSQTNQAGFLELRNRYNSHRKNPLDLFVLIAYSFNHQIRFNNSHEFNNPFGLLRSSFNNAMRQNLLRFLDRLRVLKIGFVSNDFTDFNFSGLTKNDFVYCDPPYLITTGTYNDGKRGFSGWNEKSDNDLYSILDYLNNMGVKFALSNVLYHKGKKNDNLDCWLRNSNYIINELRMNYSNSNYHTKNRDANSSMEVLITNYEPRNYQPQLF